MLFQFDFALILDYNTIFDILREEESIQKEVSFYWYPTNFFVNTTSASYF